MPQKRREGASVPTSRRAPLHLGRGRSLLRAWQSVSGTAAILKRDAGFVEQAVMAGQFNAITQVSALRRIEEAGRRLDVAVRDLRVARAAWIRVSRLP